MNTIVQESIDEEIKRRNDQRDPANKENIALEVTESKPLIPAIMKEEEGKTSKSKDQASVRLEFNWYAKPEGDASAQKFSNPFDEFLKDQI
jgi:hypothetical protein